MIARRGLLSLVGLSAAGLLVPMPKLLVYEPDQLFATATSGAVVPFKNLTLSVAREMTKALGDYKITYRAYDGGAKIGQVIDGAMMTDQLHVDCVLPVGDAVDWQKRYVVPVGETMAAAIKRKNCRVFSDLHFPDVLMAGVTNVVRVRSERHGLSLRGVLQYQAPRDEHYMRFDVIGGHA